MNHRKQIDGKILKINLAVITGYLLRELPLVGSKDLFFKDCYLFASPLGLYDVSLIHPQILLNGEALNEVNYPDSPAKI